MLLLLLSGTQNKNGYVDYLEWTNFVTPQNPDTRVLFTRGLAGDTRFDIPALR